MKYDARVNNRIGIIMKLIGRGAEQKLLQELLDSKQAEFLAIYGRRRIGKTFLIREFFQKRKVVFFNSTGSKDGSLKEQIEHFTQEIGRVFYGGANLVFESNWDKVFKVLTTAITNVSKRKKVVLFLDELPWMATKNSKLLTTLEYYWNHHWSRDDRIKLIICGSSATWIVDKIINNKGGLHNRITKQIQLLPFNLGETKEFLDVQGIRLTHHQITQLYMITGGVPYYLTYVNKSMSLAQNIDILAFSKDGLLVKEFDNLFASLFDNYELCTQLIIMIAKHKYGVAQEELFKRIDGSIKGKLGIDKLRELESAGFIIRLKPYLHSKRGIYYKVIDEYTLFYLDWIKPIQNSLSYKINMHGYFTEQQNTPHWHNWAGYAFEAICYKHLTQIRNALKLDVSAIPTTWRTNGDKTVEGTQIDLLFDRRDDAITICEIKFTNKSFNIDRSYASVLKHKILIFKKVTKTQKQIFLAMVSASGVQNSKYAKELVSSIVTLKEMFQ